MGEITKIARELPTGQTEVFHVDFEDNKVHVETGKKHPQTGEPLVRYVSENTEPFKSALHVITSPHGKVVGVYPQTKLSGPDHIKLIEPEEPTPVQDYLDELEALGTPFTTNPQLPVPTDAGLEPVNQTDKFEEDDEFQRQFKNLVEEEKREEYGVQEEPTRDEDDAPSSGKKKGKQS